MGFEYRQIEGKPITLSFGGREAMIIKAIPWHRDRVEVLI